MEETVRQKAQTCYHARAAIARAGVLLLRRLERQRLDALARGDMAAVARCEDRIVRHELDRANG